MWSHFCSQSCSQLSKPRWHRGTAIWRRVPPGEPGVFTAGSKSCWALGPGFPRGSTAGRTGTLWVHPVVWDPSWDAPAVRCAVRKNCLAGVPRGSLSTLDNYGVSASQASCSLVSFGSFWGLFLPLAILCGRSWHFFLVGARHLMAVLFPLVLGSQTNSPSSYHTAELYFGCCP